MITIVDYGMGNLGSIRNMLNKIGVASRLTSDPREILQAAKLILPGVGAFDRGIRNLHEMGLWDPLNRRVQEEGVPILGVCLGMQIFTHSSEEGTLAGLGWVDATTIRFRMDKARQHLKIPHMGWNYIKPQKQHPLFESLTRDARFYFIHSYHVVCARTSHVLSTTDYGHAFCSAFAMEHVVGVQFHPEKSHKFGFQFLKNFSEWAV